VSACHDSSEAVSLDQRRRQRRRSLSSQQRSAR
jgi:hypothetical protein